MAKWYKTDLEKVRKRYEELQRESQNRFWTPKEGKNLVRFLPAYKEGGDFFLETSIHFGVREGLHLVCNRFYGEPCYVCEIVQKLRMSEDPNDVARARRMAPRKRVFYNIVDLNAQEVGVQVFASGASIFKQLLSYFYDPDWGDLTDPKHGYDVVIERKGTGLETEYTVRPRKNPTPIEDEEWLNQLIDLDQFVTRYPYSEQKELLEGTSPQGPSETDFSEEDIGEEIEEVNEGESTTKACFGEYDKRDIECQNCPDKEACREERYKRIEGEKSETVKDLEKELDERLSGRRPR